MTPDLARIEQELAELEAFLNTRDALLQQGMALSLVERMLAPHQQRRADLLAERAALLRIEGDVADSQIVAGDQSIAHSGEGHLIVLGPHSTVSLGTGAPPVDGAAPDAAPILAKYLRHLIATNSELQLEGVVGESGSLVTMKLEEIYITLRTTRHRTMQDEAVWLAEEAHCAPGERRPLAHERLVPESSTITVNEALAEHRRLVVLGDPGSGKTTLLRYLALNYARALRDGTSLVGALGLEEAGTLPIIIPLRDVLRATDAPRGGGTAREGHARLFAALTTRLATFGVTLPPAFFDPYLTEGRAILLLDGLDEVADKGQREELCRLIETFTRHYPACRYVVTSRKVGYGGAAGLQADYVTTTVRDFSLAEVERFLSAWHRAVARRGLGLGEMAERHAAHQTAQLMAAIRHNERVRDLAINPLMLTIIALIYQGHKVLPNHRAELYEQALGVMLGGLDRSKGVDAPPTFPGFEPDKADKLNLLQQVALGMHERTQKEIDATTLREALRQYFRPLVGDAVALEKGLERFLEHLSERSGLLLERGPGLYAFSHLTFQEYLAARAVAARPDHAAHSAKLARQPDAWWHEVIRLAAGYLCSKGEQERARRLLAALIGSTPQPEAEPFQTLVLASECLRDVGEARFPALAADIRSRLQGALEEPIPQGRFATFHLRLTRGLTPEAMMERRRAAVRALAKISTERYWSLPYGEPEWIHIPAGPFWMGSGDDDPDGFGDEKPLHHLHLDEYWIARVPTTNAQYLLFIEATGYETPEDWEDKRPPRGKENHPVVNVSWEDALAYCRWLGGCIGKHITLPSEAEWEKAARGSLDKRRYPWGDHIDPTRCNYEALGLWDTTPVGIFPTGASPYGILDMAGNVWEWTRSAWGEEAYPTYSYPYQVGDGRENVTLHKDWYRVLRGGAFHDFDKAARCAFRTCYPQRSRHIYWGFRVVVSPSASAL